MKSVAPDRLRNKRIDLIDVRTAPEFEALHATGARNIPLHQFDARAVLVTSRGDSEAPIYLICKSGQRAAQAAEKLRAAGCEAAVSVDGGIVAWERAGLPVTRGKSSVISLERQVRIAAGSIVLIGAILALTVHPNFAAISAFVGAGLVFAGITDTCGMGMALARMPWNRATTSD